MNRLLILGVTLLLWGCSVAQKVEQRSTGVMPNTVLWEILSNNLPAPSYLFGTIHIIPEDLYFWPEHFQKAFDASHQIALETNDLDMDPGAMMGMLSQVMMPDGQSLEDLVSMEDYKVLSDYFNKMGMPLEFLKNMKPFILSMLIDLDFNLLQENAYKSYELEIMEKAETGDKPVHGLETTEYQMALFDSIPLGDQADILVETVKRKSMEAGGEGQTDQLFQSYVDQDINRILEMTEETDVSMKKFHAIFLDDRNRKWLPIIEKMILEQPTFIAVGAAHLPGKMGVIHLLEEAGYTLKPVMRSSNGTD